jgi:uncharacterized membrane protein
MVVVMQERASEDQIQHVGTIYFIGAIFRLVL